MQGITLEVAKKHLEAWLEADLKTSEGQSYSIGSRSLTRTNASEIEKKIEYWSAKVSEIEARQRGVKSKRRVIGVIPRDF